MSDRREKINALIRQAEEVLSEIAQESHDVVEEAEREAEANIERHRAASAELDSLNAQVRSLQAERGRLPVEHSRAMLDDDYDAELRIKERANSIKAELADAQERIEELEEEVASLSPPHNPRSAGHDNDVELFHLRKVKQALAGPLSDLRHAAQALHAAATKPLGSFEEKQRELYGITYTLEEERSWSPEWRDALRGAGNMPSESHVQVNRADPAALERKGAIL